MLGTIKYIVAYNYYPSDREQVFDQGGSYEEPNGHYIFEKPYALWNFGRGLSYTDFEYTDVHLSDTVFSGQGKLSVTLKVKNTGRRDGKEVVQLYVRDKFSSVVMPIQQLKAFKKVEVPAGGEVEVRLEMPIDELAFYNETLHRLVEPGEFEIQVGHASDDIVFRKTIVVK
jgi:glycoside hydrolase family 3, candidate beta-glycosidase